MLCRQVTVSCCQLSSCALLTESRAPFSQVTPRPRTNTPISTLLWRRFAHYQLSQVRALEALWPCWFSTAQLLDSADSIRPGGSHKATATEQTAWSFHRGSLIGLRMTGVMSLQSRSHVAPPLLVGIRAVKTISQQEQGPGAICSWCLMHLMWGVLLSLDLSWGALAVPQFHGTLFSPSAPSAPGRKSCVTLL